MEKTLSEWEDILCSAVDNGEIDESLYFEPFATFVIRNYEQNKYEYQISLAKLFEHTNAVGITVLPQRSGENDNDLTLLAYYYEKIDRIDCYGDSNVLH